MRGQADLHKSPRRWKGSRVTEGCRPNDFLRPTLNDANILFLMMNDLSDLGQSQSDKTVFALRRSPPIEGGGRRTDELRMGARGATRTTTGAGGRMATCKHVSRCACDAAEARESHEGRRRRRQRRPRQARAGSGAAPLNQSRKKQQSSTSLCVDDLLTL